MGEAKEAGFIPDASSQPREKSGFLTPASETSSHSDGLHSSLNRKRKRDTSTTEDLLSETFVVKPHPSTVFVRPRSLTPTALLPRSQLPLSCLDISSSSNVLPDCRLFESHVKLLELEERMGNTPVVLLARLDDGKSFYAVERQARGLYVLCKLGNWVNIGELCVAAIISKRHAPSGRSRDVARVTEPQSAASHSHVTVESSTYNKKKRLAIEAIQSLFKRPSEDTLADSQTVEMTAGTRLTTNSQPHVDELEATSSIIRYPAQNPASEIFENIQTQYLEALYLSKASLAYFAKGPLSRARAAFHLDYDSTLDMKDLVQFLQSLILSPTLLDKKYRDGVPGIVSELDPSGLSHDETEPTTNPKPRRSKKMKRGKNVLYPTEEGLLRRWWQSHDGDVESDSPGPSHDSLTRLRIANLRTRETQLQIIVSLEALALEPLTTSHKVDDASLPSAGVEPSSKADKSVNKTKKSLDLTMLVDLHIDRLCIWQSVESEESGTSSKQRTTSQLNNGAGTRTQSNAADVLRDFCIEVIVPFYSARLPDLCATTSQKLGGPIVPSPARPRLAKSASTVTIPPRPGAVVNRSLPTSQPGRSLRRALTNERNSRGGSRGPLGAISLMRSATAPVVPGLKREGSETPSLTRIPSVDSQSMPVDRSGVLKSRKFSQREVDLGNLNQTIGSKARDKKLDIEAELKDAISALKRPNRQRAADSMVQTAEKRTMSGVGQSRKSKKPVRNPALQAVQIFATPKIRRQKDALSGIQQMCGPEEEAEGKRQPSTLTSVLRSAARPKTAPGGREGPSSVMRTPARSTSASADQVTAKGTSMSTFGTKVITTVDMIPASPLQARQYNQQTRAVLPSQMPHIDILEAPPPQDEVKLTPSNTRRIAPSSRHQLASPEPCQKSSVEEGHAESPDPDSAGQENYSIYASLGWEDDDDDVVLA